MSKLIFLIFAISTLARTETLPKNSVAVGSCAGAFDFAGSYSMKWKSNWNPFSKRQPDFITFTCTFECFKSADMFLCPNEDFCSEASPLSECPAGTKPSGEPFCNPDPVRAVFATPQATTPPIPSADVMARGGENAGGYYCQRRVIDENGENSLGTTLCWDAWAPLGDTFAISTAYRICEPEKRDLPIIIVQPTER